MKKFLLGVLAGVALTVASLIAGGYTLVQEGYPLQSDETITTEVKYNTVEEKLLDEGFEKVSETYDTMTFNKLCDYGWINTYTINKFR